MMKFKVGDRVRSNKDTPVCDTTDLGTIVEQAIMRGYPIGELGPCYLVRFDTLKGSTKPIHSLRMDLWAEESRLEIVGGCDCGSKAVRGQNHSHWCKLFSSEF